MGKKFSANVHQERSGGDKKNIGADLHTDLRADLLVPQSVSQNSEAMQPSVLHSAQIDSQQVLQNASTNETQQIKSPDIKADLPPELNIGGAIGSLLTGVQDSGSDNDYPQLIKKRPKKKRKFRR